DLVRAVHRIDRPQQRLPGELVGVESRIDPRQQRSMKSDPRRRADDPEERVPGIRDDQLSRRCSRDRGKPPESRIAAPAVGVPGTPTGDDSRAAVRADLDDAAAIVGDEDVAGETRGDAGWTKQAIGRWRNRRDRASRGYGANHAVARVG